ncbi:hypothetical protein evm_012377 [Chilo suppressalis]|nr:hypothetical protein evm_012377 [Chilo suppressalis]
MSTATTAALEVILNITPLHIYIRQETAKTALRLQKFGLVRFERARHLNGILKEWVNTPLIDAACDKIIHAFIFDKKYRIHLLDDNDPKVTLKALMIYTDGSKTSSGTGAGVFSEDLNIHIAFPLSPYNTVFQAECMGITLATRAILSRKMELTTRMPTVGTSNSITIQWIKGHSGSRGNDAVDELARKGSDTTPTGPEPIVPIPVCCLVNKIREHTAALHQQHWLELETCRQTKLALPRVNAAFSKTLLQLSKPTLRMVTGTITGHAHFNRHLFNIGVMDSPLCKGCMEAEETAIHVLLECNGVAEYRAKYFGSPENLQEAVTNVKALGVFLAELGWLDLFLSAGSCGSRTITISEKSVRNRK